MIVITEKRSFNHVQANKALYRCRFLMSIGLTACTSTPQTNTTNAPVGDGGEGGVEAGSRKAAIILTGKFQVVSLYRV
jgi:hypothetical protein